MREKQRKLLEELRGKLVGELHTQPFTIYTDETIEDLLDAQPKTLEELTKVKGFPKNGKRVKCFGKAIVAIFNPTDSLKGANVLVQNHVSDKKQHDGVTLKKMTLLSSITGMLVLSAVPRHSTAMILNNIPTPVTTETERALTLDKREFVNRSKRDAKVNWDNLCAEKVITKYKQEEAARKALEEKKKQAAKEKAEKKKRAERKARKKIKQAEEKAKKIAARAEAFAKKERQKAKRKAEMAKASGASDLGAYISYSVGGGGDSSVKSWMPHLKIDGVHSIFGVSTAQRALQYRAYTGKYGIRMVDGRYCIAVGSHYCSTIGTKIDVVLASGTVLKCIMGDQKADCDTDATNSYHRSDGSYVEFIVDRYTYKTVHHGSGNVGDMPGFGGKVTEIRVQK